MPSINPMITTLKIANTLATKAVDALGLEPIITRGEILKRDLGLESFDYTYIQKILGISPSIYIVTYDTRYPNRYIPRSRLMNLQSSKFTRLKTVHKDEFEFSELKLSPPFDLDQVSPHISSSSVFLLRDIAGEYFRTDKLTQEINESISKYNIYYI